MKVICLNEDCSHCENMECQLPLITLQPVIENIGEQRERQIGEWCLEYDDRW